MVLPAWLDQIVSDGGTQATNRVSRATMSFRHAARRTRTAVVTRQAAAT
jgi:hypothetical protein